MKSKPVDEIGDSCKYNVQETITFVFQLLAQEKNNNKIDFGVLFTELNSDKLHRVKQTEDKG